MVKLNSRMKNQTYTAQTLIGKDSLSKKNGRLILPRVKNTSVREDFQVLDSTDNMTVKTPLDTKSLREDTKTSAYSNGKINFVSRKHQNDQTKSNGSLGRETLKQMKSVG